MPQPRHVATHAAMMKFLDKKDPKQREAEQMEVPEKVSQLKLIVVKPKYHPGQIENYLINKRNQKRRCYTSYKPGQCYYQHAHGLSQAAGH